MSTASWGPMPELAAALSPQQPRRTPRPDLSAIRVLARLDTAGGPWEAFLAERDQGPTPLGELIVDAHLWASGRLVDGVLDLARPMWASLPVGLLAVGPPAVAWGLYEYALSLVGPRRLAKRPVPTMMQLGASATVGDLFAAHSTVERIVGALSARLGFECPPLPAHRRRGGLRTEQFLKVYGFLAGRRVPRAARHWRIEVDRLARVSPLTRLAYGDLFEWDGAAPMAALLATPSDAEGPEAESWRDLWSSLIVRTLLGVLMSDAPCAERVAEAREAVARHEAFLAELEARRWVREGKVRRARERLSAARTRAAALERQRAGELTARTPALAQLLTGVGPDGDDNPRDPGLAFLHIRFLDLLVRAAVAASWPAAQEQWRDHPKEPPPSVREVLFGAGGAAFVGFQVALLGLPADQLIRLTDEAARDALQAPLSRLLDWPAVEPEALAPTAGVPLRHAQDLLARFRSEAVGEVALPLPGYVGTPATIVPLWLRELEAALFATRREVVSTRYE